MLAEVRPDQQRAMRPGQHVHEPSMPAPGAGTLSCRGPGARRGSVLTAIMTSWPLPDTDLERIEQRALRALDVAPPPWSPFLKTDGGLGGDTFIRVGDAPDVDQEMYLLQVSRDPSLS